MFIQKDQLKIWIGEKSHQQLLAMSEAADQPAEASPQAEASSTKARSTIRTKSLLRRFLVGSQRCSSSARSLDNDPQSPPSPETTVSASPPSSPDSNGGEKEDGPASRDEESGPSSLASDSAAAENNHSSLDPQSPEEAENSSSEPVKESAEPVKEYAENSTTEPSSGTDPSLESTLPPAENDDTAAQDDAGQGDACPVKCTNIYSSSMEEEKSSTTSETENKTSPPSDDEKQDNNLVTVCTSSNEEKTSSSPSASEEKKEDASVTPSAISRRSDIFQKSMVARRRQHHATSRSVGSGGAGGSVRRKIRMSGTRSLGGRSAQSVNSAASRGDSSCQSHISVQSHLSLSSKVQSLLELAADVVNAEGLDEAYSFYQKAIHAAGLEIMEINKQMGNSKADGAVSSRTMNATYHEDLRLIGIIIGLLRTRLAILYTEGSDYDRAIELCKGANQVHKHQPALKMVNQKREDNDQIADLIVVIIERLDKAQACLVQHRDFLERIDDQFSTADIEECSAADDDISVFTAKEIVFNMIEGVATDDGSILTYRDDDTLELLSVHAAEEDKQDQAINFLRDALQVQLVAMGLKQPRATQTLIRVANMYRGTGNDRKNEELVLGHFEQTASVLRHSTLGARSRGAVLNDIAVIHMRQKDYEEASKFLLDALRSYDEDDVIQGDEKASIATLHVWRNLGECYMKRENFRSAEAAFLKALDIQTDSRKIQNAAEDLKLAIIGLEKSMLPLINDANIADTICRIGKARAASGDHKRALDIFQEALSVIDRDSVEDKGRPAKELLEKSDQLCHTLYCIAESCCAVDDYEKSLRMYNLSINLRNSGGAYKNDKRKRSRIHCLSCFVGIGNVYAKAKKYPMALKQYKEALSYALASRVKEDHPIVVALDQQLKEVAGHMKGDDSKSSPLTELEKKADNEIERGALDMATETLKELLVLRRAALQKLKEKGKDTSEQVYAIACLLQTFGFVFAKNGDDQNAERAFKDAARLFRKRGYTTLVEV